ncbi:MAG: hypothetical protein ACK5NN_00605 [Sphingomonadaceae bacterium]
MYEALDPWPYIMAAYAIGIGGTLGMVIWSWQGMIRAEARRDKARKK